MLQIGSIQYYTRTPAPINNIVGSFSTDPASTKGFIINEDKFNQLLKAKEQIDILKSKHKEKSWLKFSRNLNLYEKIPATSKKFINRAAYKALDIFELINDVKFGAIFTSTHLCEAPGGFIQASNYFVSKLKKDTKHRWFASTLKNTQRRRNIPEFKILPNYNGSEGSYIYGEDNTGNLLSGKNIAHLWKNIKKSDLVTGDGGFDVSDNFNIQEQKLQKLIFAQILTALGIQKVGGSFILKIFDITTLPSLQFISLLSYYYEDVFIIKPQNSRPCNSEKYILAKDFKGCSQDNLNTLMTLFKQWKNNMFILDLNLKVPKEQFQAVRRFNNQFTDNQTTMINGVVKVIYNTKLYHEYLEKFYRKQDIVTQNYCTRHDILPSQPSKKLPSS